MDMNTIFTNLISNSIDSFQNLKVLRERRIVISMKLENETIIISYSDNGTGLPKVFEKNKENIFLPFTTSKKDRNGTDIGTGLGMYLVKNVIDDYNGNIEILNPEIGFNIAIDFPIRKKKKMKYKIGYIDEDSTQVTRYEMRLRPYFEVVGFEITPGLELKDLLIQVYNSDIDLLMIDFLMNDKGVLTYNGDEVAREFEEIKPRFPMIIFTNRESDAFPQVDNPNMIYEKSKVKENVKHFADILNKNILAYKKYIEKRKTIINDLLLKGENEGLLADEKHTLLQTQIELINLDKWSNEVPFQLLDDKRLENLSRTTKEAEEFLESILKKKE